MEGSGIKMLPLRDAGGSARIFREAPLAEGTLAWFEVLAQTTMEEGEEAVLLAALDQYQEIRAAIPLAKDRHSKLRSLTAPYTTIFAPPLPDLEWARFLGLRARSFVSKSLRLDAMDIADPGTASFLRGLAASGLAVAQFNHFKNWFEEISDFATYWARRPAHLKSTVRRKLASLTKSHSAVFQLARNGPEFAGALASYLEVYRSSWKTEESHPDFIEAMIAGLGRDALVRLATLSIDQTVVAAQIWLLKNAKATIFKLAHREDAKAFSPGTLLTYWTLEKLWREEGLSQVDFGRGDDQYKRGWLSKSRERYGVVAANWRSLSGLTTTATQILPTLISGQLRNR